MMDAEVRKEKPFNTPDGVLSVELWLWLSRSFFSSSFFNLILGSCV
jgi:hypothetical protein